MQILSTLFTILAFVSLSGCTSRKSNGSIDQGAASHTVTIRDANGSDLLTHQDILIYDTEHHIMTLVPGVRDRIKPSQSLIGGSPFTLIVDKAPIYSGEFTTSLSSQSLDDVVIDLFAPDLDDDQLRISLGYPTRECYTSKDDPRENPSLIAALRSLGKTED